MMEPQFIEITLPTHQAAFFVTEDGGSLRMKDSLVKFSLALGFEERNEEVDGWAEDSDVCHCLIRVIDSRGTLWEAKTFFGTNVLLENITDCRRYSWSQHYEPKPIFEKHTLLSGIRGFYDDRSYRTIVVEDKRYSFNFKYQYPVFDIAFQTDNHISCDRTKLWVRVSGFYERETGIIPPIYFDMRCETLMFYTETRFMPTPLVFRKMGASKQKQKTVQYVPSGTGFSPPSD